MELDTEGPPRGTAVELIDLELDDMAEDDVMKSSLVDLKDESEGIVPGEFVKIAINEI